jgi:hypothetical protein
MPLSAAAESARLASVLVIGRCDIWFSLPHVPFNEPKRGRAVFCAPTPPIALSPRRKRRHRVHVPDARPILEVEAAQNLK